MMNNTINVESAGLRRRTDHILVASIFFLTGLGLTALYSASYGFADIFYDDGMFFFSKQLMFAGIGLVLFFVASFFDLDLIRKIILPIAIITFVLCLMTRLPGIGVTKNGASRWIGIGSLTYQPSELVKLVLPFYLAHLFDKKKDQVEGPGIGIISQTISVVLFFCVIFLQNNFSTAVFITLNALLIFYFAGVKKRYFVFMLLIAIPIAIFLILTREHRLVRIISFLNPDWDVQGAGYQVRASVLTIASGGFWGKGIGQGVRKIASVPEVHSDFIFSAYAEEFGFIGIILFFALVVLFAVRGYKVALKSEDLFRRLLAFGMVTMIVSQILLNVGVVSGALPATGIPLPFFSAGGSSLATTLVMAGIIVNISRGKKKKELSYDAE
ncbi:MAG: putative lipid II flippase FtsW [Treponema sp.]|jgi:cell division protein FtsW|nr:putative lipid II flippase FtsW [Treponema sp.]